MPARHCDNLKASRGYVLLLSMLMVAAIGSTIAVGLLLLGLGSSRTSFAYQQSIEARALANACGEEALQQIHDAVDFSGQGALSIGAGSCQYSVLNTGGEQRTVTATGVVGSGVRKVQVTVGAVAPEIVLTSWQEVADF